jgi:putative drug exporter of the RND superfamily
MRRQHTSGFATRALAWIAVRLRFLVVPGCIAAAVVAGLHADPFQAGGPVLNLIPKDAPALRAGSDSLRLFRAPAGSDVIVVQRDPQGLSRDAQSRVISRAVAVSRGQDPSGARLAIPFINVPGAPASTGDSTTAITHLVFDGSYTPNERTHAAQDYLKAAGPDAAPVGVTGVTPARIEQGTLILDRIGLVELLTVLVIAVIVLVVFRAPGAAVVTLATIGVAFPITLWALTEFARLSGNPLPQEVEPLVVALLLGVVTDYAVFFLSEFRDQLRSGVASRNGVRAAALAVIPIVFTGGVILSLSLLALRASSLGFFRELAPALAATVAVAMLVSILFVPALIALVGRFSVWPVRPVKDADDAATGRPLGQRLAHLAAGRPLAALIGLACVGVLAVAALQSRSLNLGVDVISGLPADSRPQVAARAAEAGFAPGALAPLEVIVQNRGSALPTAELGRLEQELRRQPGFAAAVGPSERINGTSVQPFLTSDRRAARYVLVSDVDPLSPAAVRDLAQLQARMPGLVRSAGLGDASVEYAGQTALAQSAVDAVSGDAFKIALAVLVVNLVLMALFMRALLAPLLLLAVNVLSVAATLGITVWFFQDLLGYPDITYYVPFAGAVLLISLSSDYNVLIVGKIWAEGESRPMRDAIASAAPQASRAIRAAGLSLAASFALVALIPIRSFRELAAVMSVGILVETFLVRSLLAPALLALLGRRARWPGRSRAAVSSAPAAGMDPMTE